MKRKQTPYRQKMNWVQRRFHLAIVPHAANQYRPHLVCKLGIVIVVAALIGVKILYNTVATGSILGRKTEVAASELLPLTNKTRTQYDLGQ